MVNSVDKDRILTISLGNDLPVKIEAELAVDENTGSQGSVRFLLAPRIDRDWRDDQASGFDNGYGKMPR